MILAPLAMLMAPPPPTPSPSEREVIFPGFNAVQLKGSVRPAAGHPFFAVLVAGSGPTDRDWSNPLIPVPSHSGRDVAAWLQSQGLGSLRFDKRYIGSRDSGLDISLDAQVGDIRAALRAAKALPEAKGRKLLLVGHSEGAVLSLLATAEADALLLLAMPGEPLGKLVLTQVREQFEQAGAAAHVIRANMDFLESVLEAIRKGSTPPPAGEEVLPNISILARSLANPRSLAFFRAEMDLDPWMLAARVPVPMAAAWGDRDVQVRRPRIPSSFPGEVIDLPGANHLLRRETLALKELNPALAMGGYGDGTPLADLGPLAAWLARLGRAEPLR
ncbi:MAG: alpha/beta fold hydrolase [Acidobacteria bacterium]|nr:alpha/beta fold hydrolase [Acidobacteriota bacterium]